MSFALLQWLMTGWDRYDQEIYRPHRRRPCSDFNHG